MQGTSGHLKGSHLTTFKIDRNIIRQIYYGNYGIHDNLHKLEHFSATQNPLFSKIELTAQLLTLQHIKFLNLSRQNNIKYKQLKLHPRYKRTNPLPERICYMIPGMTCPIGFPPNLTHLDLSYSAFEPSTIPQVVLMNNNSLKIVYLSHNAIQILPNPFYCAHNVKPAFEMVDLASNKIECINSSFFAYCDWSSLKILNLKQNQLKQTFISGCDNREPCFLSFLNP